MADPLYASVAPSILLGVMDYLNCWYCKPTDGLFAACFFLRLRTLRPFIYIFYLLDTYNTLLLPQSFLFCSIFPKNHFADVLPRRADAGCKSTRHLSRSHYLLTCQHPRDFTGKHRAKITRYQLPVTAIHRINPMISENHCPIPPFPA